MSTSRTVLTVLLLVALPVALHLPTLDADFHLDDAVRILDNPGVEQLRPLGRHFVDPDTGANLPRLRQYRPLLPLTLSLDHARAGGHDAATYRQTNLALHVLVGLVLWRLLARLLRLVNGLDPAAASACGAAVALVYGCHPVAGIPVLYLCARDLLLMQLFWLTALLAWTHMRLEHGDAWQDWLIALAAAALSLLGKTNTVFAPALVLAFELVVDPDRRTGRSARAAWRRASTWLRPLPFAAVVAGFFAWTRWGLDFSDLDVLRVPVDSALSYPLTQLDVHLTHYLRNAVAPIFLRPLPEVAWADGTRPLQALADPAVAAGAVVLVGSLAWAWRARVRAPLAAFAVFAYWISLAPTSSFKAFRYAAADYRQVPGLPWLVLLAACALLKAPQHIRRGAAVMAVLHFGLVSLGANAPWQTELSLWTDAVQKGTTSNGRYNLARQLMASDPPRARALLDEIVTAEPGFLVAQISLGLLEIRADESRAGVARVRRAFEADPSRPDSRLWFGRALHEAAARVAEQGEASLAAEWTAAAAALTPDDARGWLQAARHSSRAGDDVATLAQLERLHALVPAGLDESRFLEAWAYQRPASTLSGAAREAALERALEAYDLHLAAHPDDVQARFNRGHARLQLGRAAAALVDFERCERLDPAREGLAYWLATARRAAGADDG